METSSAALTLTPLGRTQSGERVEAISLEPGRSCLVGRSDQADWPIPDASVSRRHAMLSQKAGGWFLTDLSSRNGTCINDRPIEPESPAAIQPGDVLAFGSWRCLCRRASTRPEMTTSFAPASAASISAIGRDELGGVAQHRLDVLMELTASLNATDDREAAAQAAVEAVREATGCRRIVFVQPTSQTEMAILASTTNDPPQISRSLIDQAAERGLVQLSVEDGGGGHAQSILDLRIRSAICAPVIVGGAAASFLMLDTRDAEAVVPRDAAAFCQSVARLAGLTFERINAAALDQRNRQLEADLGAARRAQETLSPKKQGKFGRIEYHYESLPGRIVAGDLFDIFPLPGERTAFFLGDVSGKGVGAAMLMAACQSQLRTHLLSGAGLADAMSAVNADLHARSEESKFVTIVAGVLDVDAGAVEVVDAGHGLVVRMEPGRPPVRVETTPGFPLGVVGDAQYEADSIPLPRGAGLLTFSDGAIEQPDEQGSAFGIERVLASVAEASSPLEAVEHLLQAVQRHAGGPLADDLTAASILLA